MTGPADDADVRRAASTIRRAATAGASVAGALAAGGVVAVAFSGGRGRDAAVVVLSALVAGVVVTCGWLLVAVLGDLLADRRPTRRLLAVTAGAVVAAFASPVLVLGALVAA